LNLLDRAIFPARRFCLALLCFFALAPTVHAETQETGKYAQQAAKSPLKVELLTIVPGKEIYNAWGHTALRITNRQDGRSLVFDYGTFVFDRYFLVRFLGGDPMYYLAVRSWEQTLGYYKRGERAIYAQELYLMPDSVKALTEFLRWNLEPANRAYKYNHYLSNCTTIYRDMIDRYLDGHFLDFVEKDGNSLTKRTFRNSSLEYVKRMPFFFHGIDLIINGAADHPITRREKMYLPDALMEELENFRKSGQPESGRVSPVITLYAPQYPPDYGSGRITTILMSSIFMLIFLLPILLKSQRLQKVSFIFWISLTSFCGIVLVLLWILNSDGFFNRNWNLLLLHPGWLFFFPVRRLCAKLWQRPLYVHLVYAVPLVATILLKLSGLLIQHVDIFLFVSLIAQSLLFLADYQKATSRA
jgi:hypothetical protein